MRTKKTSRWYEFNPVCRAEYRSFRREQPAGMPHVDEGAGAPFVNPPSKARNAGQIGRIADLHASHPEGEAQGCAE
ncbi:MAG: hypothetical protein M0Q44_20945 [Methylobacter sp.]|nr:hypothetical protein [Methylobacter sp.]